MAGILGVLLLIVGVVFLVSRLTSESGESQIADSDAEPTRSKQAGKPNKNLLVYHENSEWLHARWNRFEEEKNNEDYKTTDRWFFAEPEEDDLERFDELGFTSEGWTPLRGHMRDLSGLFDKPRPYQLECLKFFKIPRKGLSFTKADEEITLLLSDEENKETWETRPMTKLQKEFFKFYSIEMPKGLNHRTALEFIIKYSDELEEINEDDDDYEDEWDYFTSIVEEFDDPEWRKDEDIKKVPFSVLRDAIAQLRNDGHLVRELEGSSILIDKILEIRPDLYRDS